MRIFLYFLCIFVLFYDQFVLIKWENCRILSLLDFKTKRIFSSRLFRYFSRRLLWFSYICVKMSSIVFIISPESFVFLAQMVAIDATRISSTSHWILAMQPYFVKYAVSLSTTRLLICGECLEFWHDSRVILSWVYIYLAPHRRLRARSAVKKDGGER